MLDSKKLKAILVICVLFTSLFMFFIHYFDLRDKFYKNEKLIEDYKTFIKEDILVNDVLNKKYSNNLITLSHSDLRESIYEFVDIYSSNKINEEEKEKVVETFMKLYLNIAQHRQNALYYLALCSVESHFNMNSKSSVGAVGIAQIIYSVWGDLLKKEYNLTKEQIYNDTFSNIYAGFIIWKHYWRKNNFNNKLANYGYLGANSSSYNTKINERYCHLTSIIIKKLKVN